MLLVQLLSLLPAGARRHLGSGAGSPGQLRQRQTRAGAGLENAPGAVGTAGGLSPGSRGGGGGSWNRRRSGGGGGSADSSRLLAGLAPHAAPEPAREEGEGEGRGRGFRAARQEGTQTPGTLRMRLTSPEAGISTQGP